MMSTTAALQPAARVGLHCTSRQAVTALAPVTRTTLNDTAGSQSMDILVAELGEEMEDVDEETFDLFSQPSALEDLGMLDAKAATLHVSIAGRDFEIQQSPGVLQSTRNGGTTGAAVWQSTVRCAEWMASPTNFLYTSGSLNPNSRLLELGAGISGILACTLASKVNRVVATDQPYILKTLQHNISANHRATPGKKGDRSADCPIQVLPLDWETDDIPSFLQANHLDNGIDALLACDCIYNYALIDPFVQTCTELCRARRATTELPPTFCVIVQQLRQAEVFEQWLSAFGQSFRVWRIPSARLSSGLQESSGFAVHVGVLREQ